MERRECACLLFLLDSPMPFVYCSEVHYSLTLDGLTEILQLPLLLSTHSANSYNCTEYHSTFNISNRPPRPYALTSIIPRLCLWWHAQLIVQASVWLLHISIDKSHHAVVPCATAGYLSRVQLSTSSHRILLSCAGVDCL
jgi:hypothetical protein